MTRHALAACRVTLRQHMPSTVTRQVVDHPAPVIPNALLDLAQAEGGLICAGHHLLRDPALATLLARAAEFHAPVHADSHFAFRPVGIDPERGSPRAFAPRLERLTALPATAAPAD